VQMQQVQMQQVQMQQVQMQQVQHVCRHPIKPGTSVPLRGPWRQQGLRTPNPTRSWLLLGCSCCLV
jgi:hypothetical protein